MMGALVLAELKPLLRAWPPLLLAALASAVYVLGEALQPSEGWAAVGLVTGSWAVLWFYLIYFPTTLSQGRFRSDAFRELVWARRAGTSRQVVARALALTIVGFGIWLFGVLLALSALWFVPRSGPAMPWSLVKPAIFALPAVGFGIAFLFFIAALVQNRILAYALAVVFFLGVLVFSPPERSAYLQPFFTPSRHLVSEFVGFGFFAPVMYLQKAYTLTFAAALLLSAIYLVSRKRRPLERVWGAAGLVFGMASLALGIALLRQPSQGDWVARNREEWTSIATIVGRGMIPPGDFHYRVFTHRSRGSQIRVAAFAPPARCQLSFLDRYLGTLSLYGAGGLVDSAAEAPYRGSAAVKQGVLLLPERYRFREGVWCDRSAIREAVRMLVVNPELESRLRRARRGSATDAVSLASVIREAERLHGIRLLAAWYATEKLLGSEVLSEELRLWEALRTGAPVHAQLQRRGAIGGTFAVPGDSVGRALDQWKRLDRTEVRKRIEREVAGTRETR